MVKNQVISFEKLTLLEWEDGPVRVIGDDDSGPFLIVLAALDVPSQEKIFVAIRLTEKTRGTILATLHGLGSILENWEAFNKWFNGYVKKPAGEVYLITGELDRNVEYELHSVDPTNLNRLEDYSFERTMTNDTIHFWRRLIK